MAADVTLAAPLGSAAQPSSFAEFWASFRENKGAVAGLVILSLIVFTAIFADVLAPLAFDRIYGAWWDRNIAAGAKTAFGASVTRYLAALVAGVLGPRLFAVADLQDLATTIEAEDGFDLAACGVVRSPTLLIAGAEDRFYERERFVETAALSPDCRPSLYPNRGHVTVTAGPRAIAEATGFLNAGR